ncbi:MAG: hypothetical protein KOO69_04365 [Victivallales bacterium]|nr:hypothetical protein [Victivallales bacterium]
MSKILIIFFILLSVCDNVIAVDKPVVTAKNKKAKKKWDWRRSLPEIAYVYPAGGQQGTTIEVIVGGQRLRDVKNMSISGGGVEIISITYIKNIKRRFYRHLRYDFACMISKKYNLKTPRKPKLRAKIKAKSKAEVEMKAEIGMEAKMSMEDGMAMQAKKKKAEEKEKMPDHILLKDFDKMTGRYLEIAARNFFTFPNRLQSAPALREEVIVKLKIDKNATPGMRELRFWHDRRGMSNALRFYVSELAELTEERLFGPTKNMKTKLVLPAIINGQIMPGEIDSFVFKAKKGQKMVFAMMARQIIPYLGDAVPGWFQPLISIHNMKGVEMKFEDDFYCSPDPIMLFDVPADGEYELRVRDSIYRGRKDFVYRIKAGEFPFVTNIFPLGAKVGKITKIHLSGYNLTDKEVSVTIPSEQSDSYRIKTIGDPSFNPVYLAVNSLRERFDNEDNNTKEKAQNVKLDSIINGRINSPGDVDMFKISGKTGDKVVFELEARSLGSPLDAVISLCDAKGKQMFFVDDMKRVNIGFNTHQADPYYMLTLPANGEYYLSLRDIQNHGGKDFTYRLRISRPRPDFKIYSGVSSLNIRRWQTITEPIRIVRKDGFDGSVIIKEKSKKPLFKIIKGTIKKDEGDMTFRLLNRRKGESKPPFPVQFIGQAKINGKTVSRKVIPCKNMMQAFIYYHWVPFTELMAFINRK